MRKISVDNSLGEIKSHLEACGYDVVDMEQCIRPVEAVVYAGGEAGVTEPPARAPENTALINAQGLTAAEVVNRLENLQ